jgi:hypothetical protein
MATRAVSEDRRRLPAGRARPAAASAPGAVRGAIHRAGAVLRHLVHVRTVVLAVTWAGLMVVWVSTCAQLGLNGNWRFGAMAVADVGLLVILYLAEGMELAATDLLDKDPDQVANRSVRTVLSQIQAQSHVELADESGRLSREVIANRGTATIAYPLVGATYELSWDTVRVATGGR